MTETLIKDLSSTNRWLPPAAIQFLKENAKYELRMKPDLLGNLVEVELPVRVANATYGLWNNYELHEYTLKDGSKATEYIQKELPDTNNPGRVYYVGLKTKKQKFEW